MPNNQLDLIKQYCDTSGIRLSSTDKQILCKVLDNASKYNGFISQEHTHTESGKDFRGRWDAFDKYQYRININPKLSIDMICLRVCDGEVDYDYWDWAKARHITDLRRIVNILHSIEQEL